jgi:hypothetical protein
MNTVFLVVHVEDDSDSILSGWFTKEAATAEARRLGVVYEDPAYACLAQLALGERSEAPISYEDLPEVREAQEARNRPWTQHAFGWRIAVELGGRTLHRAFHHWARENGLEPWPLAALEVL